jgi:hypothetical protein
MSEWVDVYEIARRLRVAVSRIDKWKADYYDFPNGNKDERYDWDDVKEFVDRNHLFRSADGRREDGWIYAYRLEAEIESLGVSMCVSLPHRREDASQVLDLVRDLLEEYSPRIAEIAMRGTEEIFTIGWAGLLSDRLEREALRLERQAEAKRKEARVHRRASQQREADRHNEESAD